MRLLIQLFLALLIAAGTALPAAVSTVPLDGDWHFVADPGEALDVQKLDSAPYVRPTRVPSSWQTQFADLRDYAGVAWYWRSVAIEAPAADQVVLLRFGAVDYQADVYVNGQKAGSHQGGYLPFEIDVTSFLRSGENQIAVRVADPGAKPHDVVDGINYAEIPHGKQNWYVQTSGLWQSVELRYRPRLRLGSVRISAALDGTVEIAVAVIRAGSTDRASVSVEARDPAGKEVWRSRSRSAGRRNELQAEWSDPEPQPVESRPPRALSSARHAQFGRLDHPSFWISQPDHARQQISIERPAHLSAWGAGSGFLSRDRLHAAFA